MYTAMRTDDGLIRFEIHAPPETMTHDQARRALEALQRMRDSLERGAGLCVLGPAGQPFPRRVIHASATPASSPTTPPTPAPTASPTQSS